MEQVKVLICEDERIVAFELQERLKSLGYAVAGVASEGTSACEIARKENPDLALMDIRLDGGLSGTEIAQILGDEFDIPSIFLTAYADPETLEQASQSNPLGYLVKPVRNRDLELAIRFGLNQHRAKKDLERELNESSVRLKKTQSILDEYSATLSKEVRMCGLQEIIGGVAHYFNNSLAILLPQIELLSAYGSLPAYKVRQIRGIMIHLEAQKSFVQKLLRASGHIGFEMADHAIQDIISKALAAVKAEHGSAVEIVQHLPPAPLKSMVDKDALSHAIRNVLVNAVEGVGDGGAISVSLHEMFEELPERFSSRASPGWFNVITISDTGCGIPPEELDKTLEPFYTSRTSRLAIGLGLTEAYGILKGHGGWLRITSEVGVGTTVELSIPRSEIKKDKKHPEEDAPSESASTDDEPLLVIERPLPAKESTTRLTKYGSPPVRKLFDSLRDPRYFGFL